LILPGRVSDDAAVLFGGCGRPRLPLPTPSQQRALPHKLGTCSPRAPLIVTPERVSHYIGARNSSLVPFSGDAYAKALLICFSLPRRRRLAQRGRRLMVDEFNWVTIGRQLRDVVERVAITKARTRADHLRLIMRIWRRLNLAARQQWERSACGWRNHIR